MGSSGINSYHMRLSEERANTCREYLEGAGVNPRYLRSRGFGGTDRISETQPTLNQRTEFNVVDNFEEEIQRRISIQLEWERTAGIGFKPARRFRHVTMISDDLIQFAVVCES